MPAIEKCNFRLWSLNWRIISIVCLLIARVIERSELAWGIQIPQDDSIYGFTRILALILWNCKWILISQWFQGMIMIWLCKNHAVKYIFLSLKKMTLFYAFSLWLVLHRSQFLRISSLTHTLNFNGFGFVLTFSF